MDKHSTWQVRQKILTHNYKETPTGSTPLGKHRRRLGYNTTDLKEIGWESLDWIHVM